MEQNPGDRRGRLRLAHEHPGNRDDAADDIDDADDERQPKRKVVPGGRNSQVIGYSILDTQVFRGDDA